MNRSAGLRPWLTLVVGTDAELELRTAESAGSGDQSGLKVAVGPVARAAHPLAASARWAHAQVLTEQVLPGQAPPGQVHPVQSPVARVLSPRPLKPDTDYLAVLVPAFRVTTDGNVVDAWTANEPATVPVYDHWRFRTGPGGGFGALAAKLSPVPGTRTAQATSTRLSYPRLPTASPLAMRGALAAPGSTDVPAPAAVTGDLGDLAAPRRDPQGRPIVGLPRYGEAWRPDAGQTTWGAALNTDPRHRAAAGIGRRIGVNLQDELVQAVADHLGEADLAARRVRQLGLGLAAAGSLWRRRLPPATGDGFARRLWTMGPVLARAVTATGPVAVLVTGADRSLPAGWHSTATRRVLRTGPARVSRGMGRVLDPARVAPAVNRARGSTTFTETGGVTLAALGAAEFDTRRQAVATGRRAIATATLVQVVNAIDPTRYPAMQVLLNQFRQQVAQRAAQAKPLPWTRAGILLAALGHGPADADLATAQAVLGDMFQATGPTGIDRLSDAPEVVRALAGALVRDQPDTAGRQRAVDLRALHDEASAACDPTRPDAAARRRLAQTVSGLDPQRPQAPPEHRPDLDLPVWRMLARTAPEWILPGADTHTGDGALPDDAIVVLEANPAFVEALMVGLNTQLLAELRWRNQRIAAGSTPLRSFWGRLDPATGTPRADLTGVDTWLPGTALGAPQHHPTGPGNDPSGRDLVLVVRAEVFSRYPKTLVYLASARHAGAIDFTRPPAATAARTYPAFHGRHGELAWFGFPGLRPVDLADRWMALEEVAAGSRFRNDRPESATATATATDGAAFAVATLANPARVLVPGSRLTAAAGQ